ncbi:TIGR02646 family protein [Laspinema sp. A4]|uniref:retron system putative HNH endonuclease n=1 Tax=Laspinema sp. D2d TaxID=2953686 RepID=UPI0021BAF9EB|nr:retron system putative HNH endonuclease [Laspinema sp. D2d]MCT7981933.1 TIGR02646 family protein [Laspinema sp. D2d]
MRKINKGSVPPELTQWKKKNPHGAYNQIPPPIRSLIREYALKEQFYLCAYCCKGIEDIKGCHNEHIEPQNLNPKRTLDFSNIVASCNTDKQCGKAHQSQPLPLTPLMAECETEFRFKMSGRVEGLTERAIATIQVLNLGDHEKNNRVLIEKRKQLVWTLLWKNGINAAEGLEDKELLEELISDLSQPRTDKMEPFTPVVINILKNWLMS